MNILGAAGHALRAFALVLAALVLFIEEWGWRPLTALAARAARWPPLARLETHVVRASPRLALFLFLAPAVVLFPLKVLALWAIHEGRPVLGIAVIVAAKVVGTAMVGRLFVLLEPQLEHFAWFARALLWWRATKARMTRLLRASPFWRRGRILRWTCRRWWRRTMA